MGVFKEHARAFEAVAAKQKRIWSDAADYGYPYNTGNVPEDIKLLLHYVRDLKGTSLQRNRFEWKNGVTITFRIGWEIDEGMECGTQYEISFSKLSPRMRNYDSYLHDKNFDAFITVYVENYREPYKNR